MECYLVWKPTNRLGWMSKHCLNVTTHKINLAPSNLCLHTSNSILSQYLNLINVKKYKLCSN